MSALPSLLTHSLKLHTGCSIPQLGYGTWQLLGTDISTGMLAALEAGYRHFDFAKIYENQAEIGTVLTQWFQTHPELKREDYFFTSKLWNTDHQDVERALRTTLDELQLTYLDLYLIHWPLHTTNEAGHVEKGPSVVVASTASLVATWREMIRMTQLGWTHHIGVSNFLLHQLAALVDQTHVVPAVHQFELHPLLLQPTLRAFCHTHKIVVTAYCPLGGSGHAASPLLHHPTLLALATQLHCSVASVLLNWGVDHGHVVIPKSAHPDRIRANTVRVALTPAQRQVVDRLGEGVGEKRVCDPVAFFNVDLFSEREAK